MPWLDLVMAMEVLEVESANQFSLTFVESMEVAPNYVGAPTPQEEDQMHEESCEKW